MSGWTLPFLSMFFIFYPFHLGVNPQIVEGDTPLLAVCRAHYLLRRDRPSSDDNPSRLAKMLLDEGALTTVENVVLWNLIRY